MLTINAAIRCYRLACPFGRRRLVFVLCLIILAGLSQMVSVASIFPFLSLAGEPQVIQEWNLEYYGLGFVRELSEQTILITAGILCVLAILFSNAITLLAEVHRIRYAFQFGAHLRTNYLSTMVHQPYSFFLQENSGNLLQQIQEAQQFTTQVFLPLLETIARFITIVCLVAMVIYVSPIGFAGAIILGIVYGLLFAAFRNFRVKLGRNIKNAKRASTRCANQLLGGIKSVIVADKANYYVSTFAENAQKQAQYQPYVPIIANTPRYLVETLVFGSLIGFLLLVMIRTEASIATVLPTVSILAMATYRLLPAVQQIFAAMSTMQTMMYTLDDIEKMGVSEGKRWKIQRKIDLSQINFQHEIAIENLSFRYPSQSNKALDSIEIKIPKNSSLGIMGSTGSGKSTLVDALLGLHRPESGKISIDGEVLTEARLPEWRRSIGYVPQSIYLVDDTIAANIAFGLPPEEIDMNKVRSAADTAQILKMIEDDLPDGFQTVVGERGVRLSGGQMQRIGIARAMYHDPQILIFDEATSALDSATESGVVESIKNLLGCKTLIMIAHRLTTLENCDSIIEIRNGRIARRGTCEELIGIKS